MKGKTEEIGLKIPALNDSQALGLKQSVIHAAVCKGAYDEVETHLKEMAGNAKYALNAADKFGFSPLHAAVVLPEHEGVMALKMCRLLISYGAIVTSRDLFGNTSLHWAARVGNVSVMEVLFYENCNLGT